MAVIKSVPIFLRKTSLSKVRRERYCHILTVLAPHFTDTSLTSCTSGQNRERFLYAVWLTFSGTGFPMNGYVKCLRLANMLRSTRTFFLQKIRSVMRSCTCGTGCRLTVICGTVRLSRIQSSLNRQLWLLVLPNMFVRQSPHIYERQSDTHCRGEKYAERISVELLEVMST